jgi:hypothetical protein
VSSLSLESFHDRYDGNNDERDKEEDYNASIEEMNVLDKKALNSMFLQYARYYPQDYLRWVGSILVVVELLAMMTPAVAMGLQWVTALCDGPPLLSIIDLLFVLWTCVISGNCNLDPLSHCILKNGRAPA